MSKIDDTIIKTYEFEGPKAGPSLLVLGAIHGNETCGVTAAQHIIEQLDAGDIKLVRGTLTIVPICNPRAYNHGKRYMDVNLNRVIKEFDEPKLYEEILANQVLPLIEGHDFTLDIHSVHTKAEPFAFLDYPHSDASALCQLYDIPYIIDGWPDMFPDERDYTTLAAAHFAGKGSITLECGQHEDPKAHDVAFGSIFKTLVYFGLIEADQGVQNNAVTVSAKTRIVKADEGDFTQDWQHLQLVKKGQVLAEYKTGAQVVANEDSYVLLPFPEANIGDEWFYLGRKT